MLSDEAKREAQRESLSIYYLPNLPRDPETLDALFNTTATYWRTVAGKPEEIYYSVLSGPENRKVLSDSERKAFLASGSSFIDQCLAIARQWGLSSDAIALDFGCGVGRLAIHAASRFRHVHSVDFSQAHLDELKRNVHDFAPFIVDRFTPHLISSLRELDALPKVDFLYSLIALQHNTPPVMAAIIGGLLSNLNPGGVAALQVPLNILFYGFDTDKYLANPKSGQAMEMHVLPKNNIKEIAGRYKCQIVDSIGMGTRGPYSELLVLKRAKSEE